MAVLGEFIHHQTDQLLFRTFFYNGTASVLGSKRLKNVTSSKVWSAPLGYRLRADMRPRAS